MPALAIEAVQQYWVTKRWQWRWLWIAFVPAGFGVYLLVNLQVTGDAFTFLRTRRTLFVMSTSWPWVGIREAIGNLDRTPNEAEMVGAQELYFTALSFICAIASWIKLRPLYAMWITPVASLQRHLLRRAALHSRCFQYSYFCAARQEPLLVRRLTVWSLFFALFAVLFARGEWAF
jgi:hypothetical protein